jgi:hypothetical protein
LKSLDTLKNQFDGLRKRVDDYIFKRHAYEHKMLKRWTSDLKGEVGKITPTLDHTISRSNTHHHKHNYHEIGNSFKSLHIMKYHFGVMSDDREDGVRWIPGVTSDYHLGIECRLHWTAKPSIAAISFYRTTNDWCVYVRSRVIGTARNGFKC